MPSSSRQSAGPAENGSTDESATPQARDYFRASLRIVGESPLLVAWKIVGDLVVGLLRPLAVIWMLVLVGVGTQVGGLESMTPGGIAAFVDRTNPAVLGSGVAGLAASFWLIGVTFDALISGGVFASLARGLDDRRVDGFGELLECVGEGFPKVFILRVVGGAAELTMGLLGITVAIAVTVPFMSYGGLETWSTTGKVVLIAVPAFLFLSLGLLVRLTFQVAAAPLFVDDATVGEAIADGARFLVGRLAGVYRLLVFAASLLLAPLFAYWIWTLVGSLWGLQSAYAPLFSAGRLVGQVLLYTATSLLAVLFYGAIFAYYAARTGGHEVSMVGESGGSASASPEQVSPYDESTRIADLLPEQSDRVVDFSEIPQLDGSDEQTDDRD
jgi:hypothetical protein